MVETARKSKDRPSYQSRHDDCVPNCQRKAHSACRGLFYICIDLVVGSISRKK